MNIVYITYLHGLKWTGPNYSVPSQINAQAKYDNVFWYNINNLYQQTNNSKVKCHNMKEYPELKIEKLPSPFNNPDLVIFEGVYFIKYCKLAKECRKRKIPYIIVPRSSLTQQAQISKKIKKKIGNLLFFNKFISEAKSIQYLTEKEKADSGKLWNSNAFIVPNGIERKLNFARFDNKNGIRGIYIGRLDIYQKGLDIFLETCYSIKKLLIQNNCTIDIYGPDSKGATESLIKMIKNYSLEEIIKLRDPIFDEEKEKELLSSDFFILTSRFEGHPMGLIEALSYGLPSLISTGTNMGKEVINYNAGWCADTSVVSLTYHFQKLLNEKDEFELKSKNAIKLSENYNWEKLAKKSHFIYKKLVKEEVL